MRDLCGRRGAGGRRERGGARLNFLIVVVIICAVGYAAYQIVPVVYSAQSFESFMQDTVNNAAYTDKNAAWVEQQLRKSFAEYGVPPDAVVRTGLSNGRIEAQVQFTQAVPLLVTEYRYRFDKTVHSSTAVGPGG